jgi:hypothetical protein
VVGPGLRRPAATGSCHLGCVGRLGPFVKCPLTEDLSTSPFPHSNIYTSRVLVAKSSLKELNDEFRNVVNLAL